MNYQKIKTVGFTLTLADDFPAEFISNNINTSFKDGQRSSFVKLPSSKFANVFKSDVYFKGRIHSLILKQYLNRSLIDVLKRLVRPSRAERAFKAGLMLQKYGFLTPDIVAVGSKGVAGKDFLITSEVKDVVSLPEMLRKDMPERQELIRQFGETVGKMHAENIFHGDLRLGNVLVKLSYCHSERNAAESRNLFNFFFLDNERTKKYTNMPYKLRLKNLVQANMFRENISDNDRKCFFDAYMSKQNVELDTKRFANTVIETTNKRLESKGIINHERGKSE